MKIFNAAQIRNIDQATIKREPIASINLMERASERFTNWFIKTVLQKYKANRDVYVFVGMGNNGGDGLAVARILKEREFSPQVFLTKLAEKGSPDFEINLKKWQEIDKAQFISEEHHIPNLSESTIIIDAIFGSGLSRAINGLAGKVVHKINESDAIVVSIDIPSGLYCDEINAHQTKIKADYVLSFQFPKTAFLIKENEAYIKNWQTTDIGLLPQAIANTPTDKFFTEKEEVASWLKPRNKFSHKGTYGHLLVMAGSRGKMGAAQLAVKAALKVGVGLLTAYIPSCGYEIMQIAVPEAMCLTDGNTEVITNSPNLQPYKALAIGPGIGTNEQTANLLSKLLAAYKSPMVLDADALNIIAKKPDLLSALPEESILTPHPKEFERLAGKSANTLETWQKLKKLSEKHQIIVVLKGAYTAVADGKGNLYFNSTGNPGMATGGSGDVLTGIIAGLLASGYAPIIAARMGVFLHGFAGDLAAAEMGQEALVASDLIEYLGKAFLALTK